MNRISVSYSRSEESVEMKIDTPVNSEPKAKIDHETVKRKSAKKVSHSRQKRFSARFKDVPECDLIVDYFACAILTDKFMRQGMIYITGHYFAFYSNFLGYITKILVPINQVTEVGKNKKSLFNLNTITLETSRERYHFTNFVHLDLAYCTLKGRLPECELRKEIEELHLDEESEEEETESEEEPVDYIETDEKQQLTAFEKTVEWIDKVVPSGPRVIYTGAIGVIVGIISCLYLLIRIDELEYRLQRITA